MGVKVPTDASDDDVYQWISDGYVLYDGKCHSFTGTVDGPSRGGDRDISLRSRELGHVMAPLSDIECYWPVCGAVNFTYRDIGVAVYVQRRQRRQWRRTFNTACVTAYPVNRWSVQRKFGAQGVRNVIHITAEEVHELFHPTYPTVREAVQQIQAGLSISVALTPQVSVVGDGKGQFAVYYRTNLVGSLRDGAFTASVLHNTGAALAARIIQEGYDENVV